MPRKEEISSVVIGHCQRHKPGAVPDHVLREGEFLHFLRIKMKSTIIIDLTR
jgi:hypothetical protein